MKKSCKCDNTLDKKFKNQNERPKTCPLFSAAVTTLTGSARVETRTA